MELSLMFLLFSFIVATPWFGLELGLGAGWAWSSLGEAFDREDLRRFRLVDDLICSARDVALPRRCANSRSGDLLEPLLDGGVGKPRCGRPWPLPAFMMSSIVKP
jgi:hypothetical protein